ncbi:MULTISPECIES: acetyl-CoA carboxylase biotin carboxyl carrier protein [Kitasatospora]|uniref:Biotin carboxyl carrier protein of acetyl-CoA carboxylase n=2 Tax=Kitasatospora TaxID=2063 RepID=A0ABT1J7V7_9ACTN|nr:biotin/lipoyl-containing protein [Kitasatospora paracochleata]MCP2313517.1 acetyl-CoA carboxylase biotin carboxyl carrier protein [Kitasatospora paracochleata]
MTVELKGEPERDGNGHRVALIGTAPPAADLAELCRSVAELARVRAEPPARIRLEHLGTAVEIQWKPGEAPPAPAPDDPDKAAERAAPPIDRDGPHHVCAPMLGTFYHAPEPGKPPYVQVGDTVTPGQPIGILEVMKMMTPVEADAAGTVVEILVENATPVEFQQPLIAVEPA